MIILNTSGKIATSQDKTNISIPFFVEKGVEKIIVEYSYNPKTVDDALANEQVADCLTKYSIDGHSVEEFLPVKNLVTLSFDDADSYRGACHRHANTQTVVIAQKDSTPGIINAPIKSGEWIVMLNVHYVGCEVEYNILITGVEE